MQIVGCSDSVGCDIGKQERRPEMRAGLQCGATLRNPSAEDGKMVKIFSRKTTGLTLFSRKTILIAV